MSENNIDKREKMLRIAIEKLLPGFVKSCREKIDEPLLIHQDAFAAEYNEYKFLGMAAVVSKGRDVANVGDGKVTLYARQIGTDR